MKSKFAHQKNIFKFLEPNFEVLIFLSKLMDRRNEQMVNPNQKSKVICIFT